MKTNQSENVISSNNNNINLNIDTNNIRKAINNGEYERIKLYKVICSLIKDFLKKTNLTYTNNVFISECGFSELLNEEELSNSLNITYTNLESIYEDNFLAFLIKQKIYAKEKNSISTQITEEDLSYLYNSHDNLRKNLSNSKMIEKKFQEIDQKYRKILN
jgi:hypothetical protein